MKPLVPLLAVSLAANAALLAMVLSRQSASDGSTASGTQASSTLAGNYQGLHAALASGDAAALAAAGCPPEIARALAVGRAYHRQQERLRALRAPADHNAPFWRQELGPNGFSGLSRESRLALMKIQRDYQNEIIQAGEEPWVERDGRASLTSYLPPDTREKLQRIERDYSEMKDEANAEVGYLQLASDKERLQLLQTERERDIAALLGPELYAQYQMRTSPTAFAVRNRYGSVINSAEEFDAIYAIQKSYDDQFVGPNAPAGYDPAVRQAVESKLQHEIATLLGPERVQALLQNSDSDFRNLTDLTKRLDLPADTPVAIYTLRDSYAAQSAQVNANSNLPDAERSAQLKALAVEAQAELEKTLGVEAGQAVAARSDWLRYLKSGMAFSTAPASATPLNPALTIIPPPHK